MSLIVGLAQFPVLPLQRLETLACIRGYALTRSRVTLGLANPQTLGLRLATDLAGNRADCHPLRGVLALMLTHHANRPLGDFRRMVF